MTTELVMAVAMAFAIGAGCRRFDLPLPAPESMLGAVLVAAMTLGFVATGYLLKQAL